MNPFILFFLAVLVYGAIVLGVKYIGMKRKIIGKRYR